MGESDTPCSDPRGSGGGLTPLRGKTAARPPLFSGICGYKFFVFVELCDLCNMGESLDKIRLD